MILVDKKDFGYKMHSKLKNVELTENFVCFEFFVVYIKIIATFCGEIAQTGNFSI
jgi:hypothetical protein